MKTVLIVIVFLPSFAFAWGKRGHATICETAAYLTPNAEFLRSHSFDLGYYCNVPDLVWKKPRYYRQEWFNHFMDLEIFAREIKDDKVYDLSRTVFDAKFPTVKADAGRAWWRIREMNDTLAEITLKLKRPNKERKQHRLQADWLVTAGAIGHYVGDLAQPLHVTENYDGKLTEQPGIHSYFEDEVVNALFLDGKGDFEADVLKAARERWTADHAEFASKTTLELIRQLTTDSNKALPKLLETDKTVGRKDVVKAAAAYRAMIVSEMAESAVVLAELWSRHLGWPYDGNHFFNFETSPGFISPPKSGRNVAL